MKRISSGILALFVSMTFSAAASTGGHGGHGGHAQSTAAKPAAESASTQAYESINNKMHQEMQIQYTGNADIDFVNGMIPHHQAAIDMAGVVLEYGKDPKVRQLAEQIIAEQQKEIQLMQDLLKTLEKPASATTSSHAGH